MPSSYALGTHFEDLMANLIKDGRYNSKSEIIRDGLRAIEDREAQRKLKLEAMKAAINAGIESGPGIAAHDVRETLSRRYSE